MLLLHAASAHRYDYSAIVGSGPAMEQVFDLLDRVIETDLPILIEGESGTGKEVVAQAIDCRRVGGAAMERRPGRPQPERLTPHALPEAQSVRPDASRRWPRRPHTR